MNIYAYQRPLGPIADDEALRQQFIAVYDVKTHQQVVRFCRAYGHRLHKLIGYNFPYSSDIADAYVGMEQWLAGEPTNINVELLFRDLFVLRDRFKELGMVIKNGEVYLPDLEERGV